MRPTVGPATAVASRRRWPWAVAGLLYVLFLLWHEPWLRAPLTPTEAAGALQGLEGATGLSSDEKAAIRAFFSSDDGQAFYNVNLMQYRDRAQYADGSVRPGIGTGAEAADAYARVVVPMLLRRGSYPLFTAAKIAPFLAEGAPGADFFQEVAIVRYRSRRDMLEMITDPAYKAGSAHKFASLARNVAVPTRGMLVVNLGLLVPLGLLLAALLASRSGLNPAR